MTDKIPLYPKTNEERKARNLAAVLSVERGTIPYARTIGVAFSIDAPTTSAQTITRATLEASKQVRGCSVEQIRTAVNDGVVSIRTKI